MHLQFYSRTYTECVNRAGDVGEEEPGDILNQLQAIINDEPTPDVQTFVDEDDEGGNVDIVDNSRRTTTAQGRQVHFTDISVDKYIGFSLAVPAVTRAQYTPLQVSTSFNVTARTI